MRDTQHYTQLLIDAARNGDADRVRQLIPLSAPTDDNSMALKYMALKYAAFNGHSECVKTLIPVSDPKANDSLALRYAAQNGHRDCVALLIPVSDPKAEQSSALRFAVKFNRQTCIDLLYPVSDPILALKTLKTEFFPRGQDIWGVLERRIDNERLNRVLHQEIGEYTNIKNQRKM